MKSILTLFLAFTLALPLSAQLYVSTTPQNRKAIIEEFTGVKCPNCPDGHVVAAGILAANPGNAFVVCIHPFNSSYTLPYVGEPDFRRHWGDSLYMMPYCGTSRFMPSAFINRELWGSGQERITSRTSWAAYCTQVMAEPSPLNVGMASTFDQGSKMLNVTVEVYYTAAVTGSHNLVVTLAENNLVSTQSGGTSPYTHKHTLRESLTAQWGDALATNPSQGTLVTKTFTFDNTTAMYDMNNCELMAYVLDNGDKSVVSGNFAIVGATTAGVENPQLLQNSLIVYPNPMTGTGIVAYSLAEAGSASLSVTDYTGRTVAEVSLGSLPAGQGMYTLDAEALGMSSGLYIVRFETVSGVMTSKLIVE